jgi:CubicO group peptidase (beta-lactamase class C family)
MLALISERSLTVEVPVVDLFPEFGTNGKHAVTVEQLQVHTAGFPDAALPGILASELPIRSVSFRFSPACYLRIRFRVLTTSRAGAST